MGCSHFLVTCLCSAVSHTQHLKDMNPHNLLLSEMQAVCVSTMNQLSVNYPYASVQLGITTGRAQSPDINTTLQFTICRSPSAFTLECHRQQDKHKLLSWSNDDKRSVLVLFPFLNSRSSSREPCCWNAGKLAKCD